VSNYFDNLSECLSGIHIGVVTDNKDPEGIGRIKVKYAVPSDDVESAWARQITIMGGKEMGFVCFPEKKDEVLLRFVNGQSDQPVIVGYLHNGKDVIPFDNADGNNDDRIFWSRSKHKMTVNDTDGEEHITCSTKGEKTIVEMLTADEAINFTSTSDITLTVGNKLLIDAGAEVSISADMNIKASTAQNLEIKAASNVDLKGSAGVAITSAQVKFNA
jgi:uncharacterized protein involved in type VI secretion and phage assembly